MPATSEKQQHFMNMVKAVKMGHKLKGLRNTSKINKAAKSMTSKQVEEFQHMKGKG